MESMYEKLGVDPGKESVRAAFKPIIENEYPGSWVNIVTDPSNSKRVVTQHSDGPGSKLVQNIMHYLETGDQKVLGYMVDDALSMNLSDIAASGFVFGTIIATDTININQKAFPEGFKNILMVAIANRFEELSKLYSQHGFNNVNFNRNKIHFLGGETADLVDQVRSMVFDITVTGWADKQDVIMGVDRPGDKIWGFASDGCAKWEKEENSGIMSNGLTLARRVLMDKLYNERYPWAHRGNDFFQGQWLTNEYYPELNMLVGEAIISPTRQWPILIRKLVLKLKEQQCLNQLHGISVNTGGGATKIKNLGTGGVTYCKTMPEPPVIFQMIQRESGETWKNMYQSFNMGVGLDIIGENSPELQKVLEEVSAECEVKLFDLGECLEFAGPGNQVSLSTKYGGFGEFEY